MLIKLTALNAGSLITAGKVGCIGSEGDGGKGKSSFDSYIIIKNIILEETVREKARYCHSNIS